MARAAKEKSSVSENSSKKVSVNKLKELDVKTKMKDKAFFEEAIASLQLIDPTKNRTTTYSTFSKDKLRQYMQNPFTNAKNLRNLSKFLYYRSQVYRRLIDYYANMIDLRYRSVVPLVDLVKGADETKMLKSYYDTLLALENAGIEGEFLKVFKTSFIQDVFYGCAFFDDETGGMFIYPLDPDYCSIVGIESDGSFAFVMDMTYWRNKQEELELIGEPFTSMYSAYGENNDTRYQIMPPEYSVCVKYDNTDFSNPIPPFLAMFNSLINLSDLEDIQAIADSQNIYKLLVATIPTLKDGEVNDFAVDVDLALEFYQKMLETLPDYTNAIITPIPVDSITFDKDATSDVNSVQKATNAVYTTSGAGQILNTGRISGATAFTGAVKSDEDIALSSLLPQVERIVNRLLSYRVGNPAKVKFLEVTRYTEDEYKKSVIQAATYGIPNKLLINTLNGFTELETISAAHLENALGLRELFIPLASSNTMNTTDLADSTKTKSDEQERSADREINKESK